VYASVVSVEVGVRELRNRLSYWLDRVSGGEEVIITERGRAVARLTAMDGKSTLDRLIERGAVIPAKRRRPLRLPEPIDVPGGISDLLEEDRRSGY
jgi:prevent-host-death family protein